MLGLLCSFSKNVSTLEMRMAQSNHSVMFWNQALAFELARLPSYLRDAVQHRQKVAVPTPRATQACTLSMRDTYIHH